MDPSPSSSPSSPQPQASAGLVGRLKTLSFAGDARGFRLLFDAYLDAHGTLDPHGREALRHAELASGLLAFQSTSTDRAEIFRKTRKQWQMWLDILPLNRQVALVQTQAGRHTLDVIPFDMLKWGQRQALWEARDPDTAIRDSALGGSRGGKAIGWEEALKELQTDCQIFASTLIAWKAWDALDAWMGQAQVHPWEGVEGFFQIHRTSKTGHETLLVNHSRPHPLPFWATGLYAGAKEEAFWDVMTRHGGPSSPTLEPAPDHLQEALGPMHKRAGDGRGVDLGNPLGILEDMGPQATVARMRGQVEQTGAVWREQWMHRSLPSSPRPSVRPGRL